MNKSALDVGRNALIATIIVILLNPLSIYIGYWIGNHLRAPKLKIEYVEAHLEKGDIKLSNELVKQLYHKSNISGQFTKSIMLEFSKLIGNENDEKKQEEAMFNVLASVSLESQPTIIPYYLAKIIAGKLPFLIESYNRNIDIIKENIENIESFNKKDSIGPELYKFGNFSETDVSRFIQNAKEDKSEVINFLNKYKDRMQYYINICETFRKELMEILNSPRLPRTGGVTFNVGVLNYGDSDGVVFPNGKLYFSDSSLVLRKVAMDEERYDVIKAHSFKNISFTIDLDKSTKEAVKVWNSLATNYSQEKYEIVIKSLHEEHKKVNRLPPD